MTQCVDEGLKGRELLCSPDSQQPLGEWYVQGADSTLGTLLTSGAFGLGCPRPWQAPPQCRSKHTAGPAEAQPFLHLVLHRKEENCA